MKSFLKTAFSYLYDLEEKMNDLYENIQDGDFQNLNTAARYQEELERQGFYLIDTKVEQVATGLGLLAIGLDRPIAQMSGGQRAKVILAKLLLEKPDILLLDEPTTGQDQQSLEEIKKLIAYFSQMGGCVLFCTHDIELASEIADRVIIMANGKLIANGAPEVILSDRWILSAGGLTVPPLLEVSEALLLPKCITVEGVGRYVSTAVMGRL